MKKQDYLSKEEQQEYKMYKIPKKMMKKYFNPEKKWSDLEQLLFMNSVN